jgi:hypothetical protein
MRLNSAALINSVLSVFAAGLVDIMGSIEGKIESKYCGKTT